jgi:hypothetical protein
MSQRDPGELFGDVPHLGRVGTQEFPPRGDIKEQVAHLDSCAGRRIYRLQIAEAWLASTRN